MPPYTVILFKETVSPKNKMSDEAFFSGHSQPITCVFLDPANQSHSFVFELANGSRAKLKENRSRRLSNYISKSLITRKILNGISAIYIKGKFQTKIDLSVKFDETPFSRPGCRSF